jgi:NAD(P)-dependent dehydrogenase (short-subunit alcohol dehydrogenase family)
MMDSINTSLKNVPGAGKALLLSASLDLNNLSSVRKWTQNLIESGHTSIDVLVCNAGLFIQHVRSHKESYTRNGKKCEIELEDTFVSNHLGHHLLMHLLLPYLHTAYKDRANKIDQNSGQVNKNGELEWKNTDPSRVILVSSSLHKLSSLEQGRSQFLQWPNTTKDNYDQWRVYGATKLAEMLSAQHFERLLKTSTDPIIQQYKNSIYITTLHPGNPVTGVTANLPYILQLLERIFYPFMYLYRQTWQLGAFNSVWCASAPETLTYGMNQYFIHMQPAEQSAAVFDEQAAKQVYEFSEMVCHE